MKRFSLWNDRQSRLFTDPRALSPGDLLTVRIRINDRAKFKNESERSRTSSRSLGAALDYEWDGVGSGGSIDGSIDSTTKSEGDGATERSENLELLVAAVVTDVLPNGNLIIKGTQEVRVNAELRILTIGGIVRPIRYRPGEHDFIRAHCRGAHFLRWPRPPDRGPAAALRPADPRSRPALLMAAGGKRAMADTADAPPQKTGPSLVVQLGALVLMTAAAAGMGWVSGGFLTGGTPASEAAAHAAAGAHDAGGAGEGGHGAEAPVSERVIPLAAITTNLGAPSDVWVRMEASIVLDEPQDEELPGIIQQDLLAYLRTVKMHQIEGASGLQAPQGESGRARRHPQRRPRQARADQDAAVRMRRPGLALLLLLAGAPAALAQQIDLGAIGQADGTTIGYIIQMFGLLTILSIAPGLLIMVTSFTRFVIAFSILRAGIGLQTTPANLILISLSLFMTFYVMAPTFDQAWSNGVRPLMDKQITETEAFERISDPFRAFMVKNVRDKDFDLFADLARERGQTVSRDTVDLRVLVPAFMISEIRRGFEIGFLIVLPFLVIDLIVATITMAMGMMMLPPTVVSLPFKILFFVLIDGWNSSGRQPGAVVQLEHDPEKLQTFRTRSCLRSIS